MKDEFKDQRVNYIRLARKLTCMLRANRKFDPTVRVTFFRVTSSVTSTQPDIS